MKVALIANCQGESLAACMAEMNSALHIDLVSEGNPAPADLTQYVAIFHQRQLWAPNDYQGKAIRVPNIGFHGYHPDMTFVRGRRRGTGVVEAARGPMFTYNSIIAVCCYKLGIPLEAAVGFFNPSVFAKLGYFEAFERAKRNLIAEADACGFQMLAMLNRWIAGGCFMYSFNHPELRSVADVSRELLRRAGIPIERSNIQRYRADPMRNHPIWPIYPAIAERLGLEGDYVFKLNQDQAPLDLRGFLHHSYRGLAEYERDSLEVLNFDFDEFRRALGFADDPGRQKSVIPDNPYRNLPKRQFWRDSVASVEPADLDPVAEVKFKIAPADKVATAGSCFAQNIARTLKREGFNYFVSEQAPENLDDASAHKRNFGVYSARYGNIYTVRQLWQTLQRAEGTFVPEDSAGWRRKDGRRVDPFRPQIEPDGFADETEVARSRESHLAAVRQMLREMDVFVFTLGLTEGWRSLQDGAVFPLAPGVAGGEMDFDQYEFVNFDYKEICEDLDKIVDYLKAVNPRCRIVLTVSPVPLIATYEPKHALTATTYSKSVLRAAADYAAKAHTHVDYFPSYEIITGTYNHGAYYEDDLRTITDEGVSHVMRLFMRHYGGAEESVEARVREPSAPTRREGALFEIVCDEEAIVNYQPA